MDAYRDRLGALIVTIAYRLRSRYGPDQLLERLRDAPQVTIAYRLRSRYGRRYRPCQGHRGTKVTIAYRLRSRYGLAIEAVTIQAGKFPGHNRLSAPVPIWTTWNRNTRSVSSPSHNRLSAPVPIWTPGFNWITRVIFTPGGHNRLSAPVPIWTARASSCASRPSGSQVTIAYRLRSRYGPRTAYYTANERVLKSIWHEG